MVRRSHAPVVAEVDDDAGDDAFNRQLLEGADDPELRAAQADARRRALLVASLVATRKELGVTQADLAVRMGTTQSAVSEFEGGVTDPRLSTLQRYARAIGREVTLAFPAARAVKPARVPRRPAL